MVRFRARGSLMLPEHSSYKLFLKKAPGPPHLPDAPLQQRIPATLAHQARLVEALEPGVRVGQDPEFLHQFRVNLRRSRAIAEALQRIEKNKALKEATQGLKRQAQATSHLRDLDVFLETLAAWRDIPERRTVIDSLGIESTFREKQKEEHERLRTILDSQEYRDDIQRWKTLIQDGALSRLTRKIKRKQIRRAVDKQIARHNRLLEALSEEAPDSDFHELRKALKRVRYMIELDPQHLSVKQLKSRQKLLGRFQDRHVQLALLDEVASGILTEEQRTALESLIDAVSAEKMKARHEILKLKPLQR